jgi:hypothetical protein
VRRKEATRSRIELVMKIMIKESVFRTEEHGSQSPQKFNCAVGRGGRGHETEQPQCQHFLPSPSLLRILSSTVNATWLRVTQRVNVPSAPLNLLGLPRYPFFESQFSSFFSLAFLPLFLLSSQSPAFPASFPPFFSFAKSWLAERYVCSLWITRQVAKCLVI